MDVQNAVERSLSVSTGRCTSAGGERSRRRSSPTAQRREPSLQVRSRGVSSRARAIVVASWNAKETPWDRNFQNTPWRTPKAIDRWARFAVSVSCTAPSSSTRSWLRVPHVTRRSLAVPIVGLDPLEEAGVVDERVGRERPTQRVVHPAALCAHRRSPCRVINQVCDRVGERADVVCGTKLAAPSAVMRCSGRSKAAIGLPSAM